MLLETMFGFMLYISFPSYIMAPFKKITNEVWLSSFNSKKKKKKKLERAPSREQEIRNEH